MGKSIHIFVISYPRADINKRISYHFSNTGVKCLKLKDKVAIVTGASRGIGRIIALTLAREGARVVVTARSKPQLDELVIQISEDGGDALAIAASVSDEEAVQELINQTLERFGTIDILVNNAGIGRFAEVINYKFDDFKAQVETNLYGVFLISKAVLPTMLEKKMGSIVNIVSIAGINGFAGGSGYCASKFGVMGFIECLHEEVKAQGIRVTAILPGSVNTMFSGRELLKEEAEKRIQPEDLAKVVLDVLTIPETSLISQVIVRPPKKYR